MPKTSCVLWPHLSTHLILYSLFILPIFSIVDFVLVRQVNFPIKINKLKKYFFCFAIDRRALLNTEHLSVSLGNSPYYQAAGGSDKSCNTGSAGSFPRAMPIRCTMLTRSMAAAAHNENLVFANSLSATTSFASSLDKASSLQRFVMVLFYTQFTILLRLSRQRAIQHKQLFLGSDVIHHSTPTRVFQPFDNNDLLSFGGDGNQPANSLTMGVEFCFLLLKKWNKRSSKR